MKERSSLARKSSLKIHRTDANEVGKLVSLSLSLSGVDLKLKGMIPKFVPSICGSFPSLLSSQILARVRNISSAVPGSAVEAWCEKIYTQRATHNFDVPSAIAHKSTQSVEYFSMVLFLFHFDVNCENSRDRLKYYARTR